MKVRDLEYVENQMIPRMEKYVPDAMRFSFELEKNAVANAAAEAAKEELKAKGVCVFFLGKKKIEKILKNNCNLICGLFWCVCR